MGLGDEIMATGHARLLAKQFGCQVAILDQNRHLRRHEVFEGNPYLVNETQGRRCKPMLNAPGCRPYLRGCDGRRFYFNDRHRAVRGDLWFSALELDEADSICSQLPKGFWVIEPNVKGTVSGRNKDWGFDKWQAVAGALGPLIQFTEPVLRGAERLETQFRVACAVLRRARGFIGTDGALHHAAAALDVPALVIWGGYSSPVHLGYERHLNIHDGGEPCGSLEECPHCREKMADITPDMVIKEAKKYFSSGMALNG